MTNCEILDNATYRLIQSDRIDELGSPRCPFLEAGQCPGSTNTDDCLLIEDYLSRRSDTRILYVQPQPSEPKDPNGAFIGRLDTTVNMKIGQ